MGFSLVSPSGGAGVGISTTPTVSLQAGDYLSQEMTIGEGYGLKIGHFGARDINGDDGKVIVDGDVDGVIINRTGKWMSYEGDPIEGLQDLSIELHNQGTSAREMSMFIESSIIRL